MAVQDIPPPPIANKPETGWTLLIEWLTKLRFFVRTPALVTSNGNVPTSPTALPGDNTTQIATTAFVTNAASTANANNLAWYLMGPD